jgi:hypothetical protein
MGSRGITVPTGAGKHFSTEVLAVMAVLTRRNAGVAAVVLIIAGVVVVFIVLSIILRLLGANPNNEIVNAITDVGRWLTTPFHDLFPRRDPEEDMVLNWGIAALVYAAVAALIARVAR